MTGTNHKQGFTLVEILVYLAITVMLLMIVTSSVLNIFYVRQQARSHEAVQQSARFIISYLTNKFQSTKAITDISPAPAHYRFDGATSTADWFTVSLDSTDLVYEDQSGAPAQRLNQPTVSVSDFQLTPTYSSTSPEIKGLIFDLTLEAGSPVRPFSYATENYQTFLGIRP